jgi:hypothetical protein
MVYRKGVSDWDIKKVMESPKEGCFFNMKAQSRTKHGD